MNKPNLRFRVLIALLTIFGVLLGILALELVARPVAHGQVRMAEWKEETPGRYTIHYGPKKIFRFDGRSDPFWLQTP